MFSSSTAPVSITMDRQLAVVFRNVGQLYFPQTRVECHYSLSPDHQWSSSDWIGIFEVHSAMSHTSFCVSTETHKYDFIMCYRATGGLFLSQTVSHVHVGACS